MGNSIRVPIKCQQLLKCLGSMLSQQFFYMFTFLSYNIRNIQCGHIAPIFLLKYSIQLDILMVN